MFRVTDKTRDMAQIVFSQIAAKKRSLFQRQIALLEEKSDLISRIDTLQFLHCGMERDESEEAVLDLQREVLLIGDPKTRSVAAEKLGELAFSREYPIADEVAENSLDSNFASRIRQIEKTMVEQNSLVPFKEMLDSTQQRETMRHLEEVKK